MEICSREIGELQKGNGSYTMERHIKEEKMKRTGQNVPPGSMEINEK